MLCPNCGTENPANAKFCNECGINLLNNKIKVKGHEGNKNLVMWIIIAFVLIIGFLFQQYLTAVIAAGVVVIALKH
jgi:ribosomal protein L40E